MSSLTGSRMLSHRTKLTLVAACSSGALFLALFVLAAIALRRSEIHGAESELGPALAQVAGDLRSSSGRPDLAEVVQSNPQISVTVFDRKGSTVAHEGRTELPFSGTVGQTGDLVLDRAEQGGYVVVVGAPWAPHAALLNRFFGLCFLLWLPLVGVVALATSITARATFLPLERLAKEAEELSTERLGTRLHTESSGEFRDFALRLNRFLDRLEASVNREERFLSDAAHELRTPLTVMRGEIESTLSQPRTSGEYQATLVILRDETARVASLVELLLRSAESGPREPIGIDLHASVERAHARWVERFTSKGVGLQLKSVSAACRLGESEFEVVIDNLLANALRVSEAGTATLIETVIDGGSVQIAVVDEGPGVPAEDAERVFERFARLDVGRSRSQGGFGIGLSLCKRIVEAAAGEIRVEPNVPRGSRFIVRLPSA